MKEHVGSVWLVVLLLWESLRPYTRFWHAASSDRALHGIKHIFLAWLNSLVTMAAVPAWLWSCQMSHNYPVGLLWHLPLAHELRIVCAIVLLDFWTFWWHILCHRVPALWACHRVHHTDTTMDTTSASRFHMGEIAASSLLRAPVLFVLGIRFDELVLYETCLIVCNMFQHANIDLGATLDAVVATVLVTPRMHRIHHSRERRARESNYASILSVWDRLCGTFTTRVGSGTATDTSTSITLPAAPSASNGLGVIGWEASHHHTLWGLVKQPWDTARKS
jgi:sterol desaturase/sphingolipid hydroxylase (fatty acid hydroxylase superfamily)